MENGTHREEHMIYFTTLQQLVTLNYKAATQITDNGVQQRHKANPEV